MLVVLPAVAGLLLYLSLRKRAWEWRIAALATSVVLGVCVWGISEGLGHFTLLTRAATTFAWLLIIAVLLVLLRRHSGAANFHQSNLSLRYSEDLGTGLKVAAFGAGGTACFALITALFSPPNTWDAMIYHLPRAVMWISNRSVGFYPTPDYQQLILAPWAEYAMAQTILLSGNDRFVNLVEFLSYLGCALSASLIAGYLGARTRGQVLAAVVALTIPTMVLEASGPMNTAVVTLWIAASAAFVLAWNASEH